VKFTGFGKAIMYLITKAAIKAAQPWCPFPVAQVAPPGAEHLCHGKFVFEATIEKQFWIQIFANCLHNNEIVIAPQQAKTWEIEDELFDEL
jgi:hypothetical protein